MMDTVLMFVRLGLQVVAGGLVTRGVIDDATGQALVGGVLSVAAAFWSYRATRAAVASVPPEVHAELEALRALAEQLKQGPMPEGSGSLARGVGGLFG